MSLSKLKLFKSLVRENYTRNKQKIDILFTRLRKCQLNFEKVNMSFLISCFVRFVHAKFPFESHTAEQILIGYTSLLFRVTTMTYPQKGTLTF